LISDIFGLEQARSVPAELAIKQAKVLQLEDSPRIEDVRRINEHLLESLAPDDEFWPRWLFFAEKCGIKTRP
jgi:hypothetical protein